MTKEQKQELSTEVVSETGFTMSKLIREDDNYMVFQEPDGKFKRKMKFKPLMTFRVETPEEKMNLLRLRDKAIEMKDYIGKEILIEGVIIEPFDRVNEDTGEQEYGATTTIITDGFSKAIVTSSSTVYMKINEWFKLFGEDMFIEGSQLTVKPIKQKGRDHQLTSLQLV